MGRRLASSYLEALRNTEVNVMIANLWVDLAMHPELPHRMEELMETCRP
jgi:hypothetical protein